MSIFWTANAYRSKIRCDLADTMPKTHTQTVVEAVVGIMNDPTATVDEKLKAAHLFQSFQTLEPKKRRRGRPTKVEADKARMQSMFGVSQG